MTDQPRDPQQPGTPAGMTNEDVERRSRLARFLEPGSFPCSRDELVEAAIKHQAPAAVLGELRGLPDGQYANVQEIARALGLGTEAHRA
jgi:hypothetical protein